MNIDWKKQFKPAVLSKGNLLYQEGKVTLLENEGNRARASVQDGFKYEVRIIKGENSIRSSCSCSYGRAHIICQHVAAALYEMEDPHELGMTLKSLIPKEEERLFVRGEFKGYVFDLEKIFTNKRIKIAKIAQGKKLYEDGLITLKKAELSYLPYSDIQVLKAEASIKRGDYAYSVHMTLQKDLVNEIRCDYCNQIYQDGYYYYRTYEMCAGEIAMVYLLKDYVRKYNPGDETDRSGARFLQSFTTYRAASQMIENDKVRKNVIIEPRIIKSGDGVFDLSFKIGITKMYILKNMSELSSVYRASGTLPLGKNNVINFAIDDFTDESRKYYDLIADTAAQFNSIAVALSESRSYYYDFPGYELKSTVRLSGVILDRFYDLVYGRQFHLEDKTDYNSRNATIRFFNGDMNIVLHLRPFYARGLRSQLSGLELSGELPSVIKGGQYIYFENNGVISRLSEEDYRSLKALFDEARDGVLKMRIGMKNLANFYYRLLPMLKENPLITLIDETEDIVDELPPEIKASFYLDVDYSRLICIAAVRYGEKEYELRETGADELNSLSKRNIAEEEAIMRNVKEIFPYYDTDRHIYYEDKNGDNVYALLNTGLNQLMALGDVQVSEAFKRLRLRKSSAFSIGISVESGVMDLELLSTDISSEELLELLYSYRQKKKYHLLRNGDFISLEDNETLEVLMEALKASGSDISEFVKGKLHLPLYRALYLETMLEKHEAVVSNRDDHFRKIIRDFQDISEEDYEIPEHLKGVLRPYQEYGYRWMRMLADHHFGGILADDMGLGKTVQFISLIQGVKDEGQLDKPALVICPTSVVYNWVEEFLRFSDGLKAIPVVGTAAQRRAILKNSPGVDAFVTSYDLLKRDIDAYSEMEFSYQVLDEAQNIKNIRAANSKSVKIINSDHRFALTGTPIENRLSELWSIFDFIMPGFLYSYDEFKENYEKVIVRNEDEEATERLRQMVRPFILRRLKEDVLLDLPEKLEEIRYVRFEEKQQKIYDAQVTHMRHVLDDLDNAQGKSRIIALSELTKIREICCDPSLIMENYDGESAKKDACMELIQSAVEGGHRILVFSQFTSMLEILEKELAAIDMPYYKLTGETSKKDRNRYMHAFNEREDVPVFLISLKAGGTGLNLTGADVVIHYDPWWNFAAQNQATDRAHRIGQTKVVSVFKLIAKDSVEERILQLQNTKKDLSDAILSGENTSLASFSKEELLELLS